MDDTTEAPRRWLRVEPLAADTFAPFGEVIELRDDHPHTSINEGYAERYDGLARLDTGRDGGHPRLSVFRARPRALPFALRLLERHRLGSQSFVPLRPLRFLVVVARPGPAPQPADLHAFLAAPGQGVHYAAGTWHHPLIALDDGGDFLVIDRGGPGAGDDCDESPPSAAGCWVALP